MPEMECSVCHRRADARALFRCMDCGRGLCDECAQVNRGLCENCAQNERE